MSQIAIRVEGLSKQYRIGANRGRYRTLRDDFVRAVAAPWRRLHRAGPATPSTEPLWALRDVSFEVARGEIIGIIGRNGAGKSTLLKVLSRITEPTAGYARIYGRVGSLLEVGTGFHPELTGRDNICLNGAILGMKRSEVARKFDAIVEFSEISAHIDTPVKHYSSGMYMRLAFAVAAHLDPDILVIDEVLAVGDVRFQKKCLLKMEDVSHAGRTVLFVSHNMSAVQQLTSRCILLDDGIIGEDGHTDTVVAAYMRTALDLGSATYNVANSPRKYQDLSRKVEFLELELLDAPTRIIAADAELRIRILLRGNAAVRRFRASLTIVRLDGTPVGSCFSLEDCSIAAGELASFVLVLRNTRLAPGHYCIGIAVGNGNPMEGHTDFDIITDVLHFEVMPVAAGNGTRSTWASGWGSIRLDAPQITRL